MQFSWRNIQKATANIKPFQLACKNVFSLKRSPRIKAGHGPKEAMKAKAILAPADNDGLEAVFYNFCGVGHSDMDGKGFKKLCQDCSLMDKKLDTTTVDLIFADNRVKPRGMNRIDFYQFEIALELVAEKKALPKIEVRTAMITQGTPKTVHATSTKPTLKAKKVDNARLISEKRIAAILRRSPRELGKDSWKKEVDNTEAQRNWSIFLVRVCFGCCTAAQKVDTRVRDRLPKLLGGMSPQFIRLQKAIISRLWIFLKCSGFVRVNWFCSTNWIIQGSMEGVWLGFQSWTYTQTCL